MAKYKFVAVLAAPDTAEPDKVIDVDLADKHALHKVEQAMIHCLQELQGLVQKELDTGKKEFDTGEDPQLMTFNVLITKDNGFEFGAYNFRWPNQTATAREYLRGMFDGIAKKAAQASKEKGGK